MREEQEKEKKKENNNFNSIYDKSEKESISDSELDDLINDFNEEEEN